MKKLFFANCFIFLFVFVLSANADVMTIEAANQESKTPRELNDSDFTKGLPDPNNLEEVINFFKNRFENASVSTAEEMGDLNKSTAMDIQHSKEYMEDIQQEKKSIFEKMYEAATSRLLDNEQTGQEASSTTFYTHAKQTNAMKTNEAIDFAVVNVTLPTGKKIVAPALEHVPYLLTSINILPTGLIQIDEEITVVANNKKVKNGVIKVLPKFSTSRSKVRKKLDITLLDVTVNGQKVPHILEEIGNKIYIKPQEKYTLAPGVYNYKFSYLLDRKLWYYDDFTEFYWDVSGSYLNLVIGSANAIISIPEGKTFLSQNVITGFAKQMRADRATIVSLAPNALGVASLEPLLPGEGMHVLVSLDKDTFLKPDLSRNFVWFITDFGDIAFAFVCFIAVLVSYILSWKHIKKNKIGVGVAFKNTASSVRYFLKSVFDKKSFVSFLLELYKKQYIDIQKQDNKILLIKKTDKMPSLSKAEKKALKNLFLGKESVIEVSQINVLKFKRAFYCIEKGITKSIKRLNLKLNVGYLTFSIGMLFLSEIAIALLGINAWQTFFVLLSASITIAFYTYMIKHKFNSKILSWIVKVFGVIFVLLAILMMSIYIHLISAFLIAVIIYIIFEYSYLFAKRNGLMKSKINEAENLKSYLEQNATVIMISQDFINQQANIYALDLESLYIKAKNTHKKYILDLAKEIEKIL